MRLDQVRHMLLLLEQHGLEDNHDGLKDLFETPVLSLVLRVAGTARTSGRAGQLRTVDIKALRRILGLPEEEFRIFCPPATKEAPWVAAGRVFRIDNAAHPTMTTIADEVPANEPRGNFTGELLNLRGHPSFWMQEFGVKGLALSTLYQLICFCRAERNWGYMKHVADGVGHGHSYTIMSGQKCSNEPNMVWGVRITTSHIAELVKVPWNLVSVYPQSRLDLLLVQR